MKWSASELTQVLSEWSLTHESAQLLGPDVAITGASFDSRDIQPGQMFVPLVAERDGHDFVQNALDAGAVAYLTSRKDVFDRVAGTAILVPDTAVALRDSATWVRTQLPGSTVVVGITGSVGKTSTKDFATMALGALKRVTANVRSFNNEQGLPVTILNAPSDCEVLILEMGMRGFGQIADLCRIARPSIGVVTRIGDAHTELVGGIEGVAQAKGELIEALPPQGVAILNADDVRVKALSARTVARVVTYGEAPDSDVRIESVSMDPLGRARAAIRYGVERVDLSLNIPGRHMVSNAAAALAIGVSLGLPLESMARALSTSEVSAHRMHLVRSHAGALVIDDTYNANPTSMVAALEVLASVEATARIAVLGVMAELSDAPTAHRAIAAFARDRGVEILAVGTDLYGVESMSLDAAASRLAELGDDAAVLVKGSRVARLERLVEAVTG